MRRRSLGFLTATLLGCTLGSLVLACGPTGAYAPASEPPKAGVEEWNRAVRDNDPRLAYSLLSDDIKKSLPYESFEVKWKESQTEIARQADALREVMEQNPHLGEHGKLILSDGKSTHLVHESDGWRLDTPLLSSARAPTPQDALRLFAQAVEQHSFDAAMKVLTSTRRDGLRTVLDSFVTSLNANLEKEIKITNNERATFLWNDGKRHWKITLKNEDGDWRIEDLTIVK